MNIVEKNVDELIPYENNPRDNSDAVEYVANSIKEFGFKVPIVIDKNNVIVAGHTRLEASKLLGLDTVPCIIADDLTEEQVKAYRLADNKVSEFSKWDEDLLLSEIEDIFNIDLDRFGFELDIEQEQEEEPISPYTAKVNIPQYEPTGERYEISELVDISKCKELLEKIDKSNVSDEEKEFLRISAYRHNVFKYKQIAEYYAQASKEMQELIEDSALVIIDIKDAIAKGYAVLKNSVEELVFGEDE